MNHRASGTIPSDISLKRLSGEELLSVVLGKNHIELLFEHTRLNVEGGYEILADGRSRTAALRGNLGAGAEVLAALVGSFIARAEWVSEKGLRLCLTNGTEFTATVDGSGFESFSFNLPGEAGCVVV